ncbi:hypothetical protein PQX77_003616 [Marasmius sp. AFHP31]|nr:hypothetical protein PQX77_003616 [Marasmius sp. AFHP31]
MFGTGDVDDVPINLTEPVSHTENDTDSSTIRRHIHPVLRGDRCDQNGRPISAASPPEALPQTTNPWSPFESEASFRLADHLFRKTEMSKANVNELLDIWYLDVKDRFGGESAPLSNHRHLLETIDAIRNGDAAWSCYETSGKEADAAAPDYEKTKYQVWYRDPDTVISTILSNREFAREFDPAPYIHIDSNGTRRVSDFMSGNYAYRHATTISQDYRESVDGAMYCPLILGADKTTVSVATGHVEYHPLHLSIGNLHNGARRGHRNGVVPIGFLAIPKADRKYDNDPQYRIFKKQLYHACIAAILMSIEPAMRKPVVRMCPDGYYRRVIYDLAAFIADYPEQVLLAGIVQGWCCRCTAPNINLDGESAEMRTREWFVQVMREFHGEGDVLWDNFGIDDDIVPFTHYFPRADIHEMLTADLLHQVVKGCFKDMLVEWVWAYLEIEYGDDAPSIMDDIDKRISVVPEFPGLRRFPHGRRFKQWTGDDSKALMKVFLPAVEAYIPAEMSKCLTAFLDFCYLVRRNDFNEGTIHDIQHAIERFHHHRQIFVDLGLRNNLSIPHLHSMIHYPSLILDFGAPNGVCSSITESRHITAVKKPWRRSNRHNALSQILLTNQRLDKLAAKRSELTERGLIPRLYAPTLPNLFESGQDDHGPVDEETIEGEVLLAKKKAAGYPSDLEDLAAQIDVPDLPWLTQRFLYEQLNHLPSDDVMIDDLPPIPSNIKVFHSAVATFHSPSDEAGIRGMCKERIRSNRSYRGHARYDTVIVATDQTKTGFRGLSAARVLLFFSFAHGGKVYSCALVHWLNKVGQTPSAFTGMWAVSPSYRDARKTRKHLAVIHLDTMVRGVHLIPIFGASRVPRSLKYYNTLDVYRAFYVNKYADYHSNEYIF